jgi:hypothetical protein
MLLNDPHCGLANWNGICNWRITMPGKEKAKPKHLIIPGALLEGTPLAPKQIPPPPQKGLQDSLVAARTLLWQMIQYTPPKTFNQAQAAVEAYKHVDRALELCQTQLSQLPLPEGKAKPKEEVTLL